MRPDALSEPLPEWLWLGRVVRCVHGVDFGFDGEGVIVRHGREWPHEGHILVRFEGGEDWYGQNELTPSGSALRVSGETDGGQRT